ncbi:Biotin/lipoate A/B protein ligase [Bachmanniomyces sp. S44760]|nr:Biotin/lipoate A/B protein ligase [Bachmanniomyces sp. S44760]
MVVRAIRQLNPRARVNERHDIVLDQGAKLPPNKQPHPDDTHTSAFFTDSPALKVSGSAFKLTRKRSLHHGTCLVQSPNLKSIHPFLDAPVRHYMKARGVDSVRSPISNIQEGLDEDIQTNVSAVQYETIKAFVQMYGLGQDALKPFERPNELRTEFQHGESWVSGHIEGSVQHLLEIRAGVLELKSDEWIYGQTPQFTLSSHPSKEDPRPRPALPAELESSTQVNITCRHGTITSTDVSISPDPDKSQSERASVNKALNEISIRSILDFRKALQDAKGFPKAATSILGLWLNKMFGK